VDIILQLLSSQWQWLLFDGEVLLFGCLLAFQSRNIASGFFRLGNPDLWLLAFILVNGWAYVTDYAAASASHLPLSLLTGATAGKLFSIMLPTRTPGQMDYRRCFVVCIVTVVAAALSMTQVGSMRYQYRGVPRFSGLWDNPNIYGAEMACGTVLSIGLLLLPLMKSPLATWFVNRPVRTKWMLRVLFLSSSVSTTLGMLRSYSRGAWLAALFGIAYLILFLCKLYWRGDKGLGRRIHGNLVPTAIIVVSLSVIAFWSLRDLESRVPRRLFSLADVKDFSWRNRLSAWEGALQIMKDHPFSGVGWNRADIQYISNYSAPRVEEGYAIQVNSFLTIGMSIGIPALIFFSLYFGSALRFTPSRNYCITEGCMSVPLVDDGGLNGSDTVILRAGAMVILITCWFDGGLFSMSKALPLWVLVEWGRANESRQTAPP